MRELINTVKNYWENKPLTFILIIALFVRLIAVVFAKGYGMHDDHFLVIEVSQSWVEGNDVMHWFSKTQESNDSGRSFIYPGMHYLLFKGLESIGIFDPQIKMYIVRLLHALFSLITVVYGYKITEKISGTTTAKQVGLVLALLWLFPSMSVRNLIEMVVIPMLMLASWWVMTADERKQKWWLLFAAGILVGIAFPIRYQTLFFTGGIAIVLVYRKKIKESFVYLLGMCISIAIISGWLEWLLWGYPFGKMIYYIKDNFAHSDNYSTLPWYTFIEQVLIIFIPPVSFFIFIGQFKVYKKYLLLFIPTFLFFAFHSYFPNKQERFIFTILPFMLIMGIAGWNEIQAGSTFWQKNKSITRGLWIFFWIINSIVLLVFIFSSSKNARVEAAYYFHDKDDLKGIIVERTETYKDLMLPKFYMEHKWVDVINYGSDRTLDSLKKEIEVIPEAKKPNYVLFLDETQLDKRVEKMKALYPNLKLVYTANPSLLDWALYKMNPVNINQVVYVYKVE
jgi:4-amino-4-deoxy-L-arabinose transferase-like glycosyltransferase